MNTVVDDGTDIADLMSCFTKKMVNNPKFPELSAEVQRLKNDEGGTNAMCAVMQHYETIARIDEATSVYIEIGKSLEETVNCVSSRFSDVDRDYIASRFVALSKEDVAAHA